MEASIAKTISMVSCLLIRGVWKKSIIYINVDVFEVCNFLQACCELKKIIIIFVKLFWVRLT